MMSQVEVTLYTRGKKLPLAQLSRELAKIDGLIVTGILETPDGYTLYLSLLHSEPNRIFNTGLMVGMLAMEIIAFVKFDVQLTTNY